MSANQIDAVALDFDSTLTTLEGIDELARNSPHYAAIYRLTEQAMNGEIALDAVYEQRLTLLRPSQSAVCKLAQNYTAHLCQGAGELITRLKQQGIAVAIVSGGLYEAIVPVAEQLGIAQANVFAVKLAYDAQGEYDHLPPNQLLTTANGKAQIIADWRKRCGFKRVMMIGDGMSDVAARAPEAAFAVIGYGGVVKRALVMEQADYFIEDRDLSACLRFIVS